MALFPNPYGAKNGPVSKTHTGLSISPGAAPAEKFIVSRQNDSEPFIYEYGPEGNQTVLIAKGKILEAVGEEFDRDGGFTRTAVKVAGEDSERAIGVNHHNVYDQRRGAMEGNNPTVLTRDYIEVPLFESDDAGSAASTAKAMHFGAAYGLADELRSGDFVVAGLDGNFKKYDKETHDPIQIIGQVLNVTRELPPSGFLQYYTGLQSDDLEQYLKDISAIPGANDSNKPYGAPYSVGGWKPEHLIKAISGGNLNGIPFLTDGYFSALQEITASVDAEASDDNVEGVRPGDHVTIEGDAVTVSDDAKESLIAVKLAHRIDRQDENNISVVYTDAEGNDVEVSQRDFKVDFINNTVVVYLEGGATYNNITITAQAVVNPTAGIPTEWDYQGSVGAARILLQR